MPSRTASTLIPLLALALLLLPRPQPGWSQAPPPQPVSAEHGMVVSASGLASDVGVRILRDGGNAVDAAVAVGLALAVVYPQAGNLGGGGFLLLRQAGGRAVALDFREVAPARASKDLYLDSEGQVIPEASLVGHRAAGVPGTVAGLGMALRKYGRLSWARVVEPARRLAAEGFPVSPNLARALRSRLLSRFPESRRIFQREGRYYEAGEVFKQPELAATLERLQRRGPEELYTGRTAELLAREMSEHGGLITKRDLRAYRPVEREPLRGTFRGYEILTMPPPSSGGIALLEMLNVLERRPDTPSEALRFHYLIETMRRAFADRSHFPADPAFVKVPAAGLTSKAYAAELFRSINPQRATPSTEVRHGDPAAYESPQTTHYSVVDAAGNLAAVTYTLNGSFGCGVTVKGAGFLLNNEMDDFTAKPGVPNLFGLIQGEQNSIQPGKRPLSSMTPTLLTRGKLRMAVGSPGGPTIINTVLQVVLNVTERGMNLQEAVNAPRLHHQWLPDEVVYEPDGLAEATRRALEQMGHRLAARPRRLGDAAAVLIDPATGARLGAADPRNPDARAAGY